MIFRLLYKRQLKPVRRVCKLFETLISPLLFDDIYISPHRPNLDVFRQITEHPHLCRYPRGLVYDIFNFKANIELSEYCEDLRGKFKISLMLESEPLSCIHHAEEDIEDFMRMVRDPSCQHEDYSSCRVVQRGFEIYRERAEEENHYNSSGQFLSSLCIGLMKLPNLEMAEFRPFWFEAFPRGPLARTWSPFHLKPEGKYVAVHEFDNLISAFSSTRRQLKVLETHLVPYEKFCTSSSLSRTFRQHGRAAMYHLECLSLKFDIYDDSAERALLDSGPEGKPMFVDLLAAALLDMPGLRRLSLTGTEGDDGELLPSTRELFQAARLPALEDLSLSVMSGSAAGILAFLRAQPRLRRLYFREIELSEGTWPKMVDDMRRWLHLESLSFEFPLMLAGGVELWDELCDENELGDCYLSKCIEHYVLHGGENPLRVSGMTWLSNEE